MGWEIFKREKIISKPEIITILRTGLRTDNRVSIRFTVPVVKKYKINEYPYVRFAYDKRNNRIGFQCLEKKDEGAYPINKDFVFGITGILIKYNLKAADIIGHYTPYREFETDAIIAIDLNKKVKL